MKSLEKQKTDLQEKIDDAWLNRLNFKGINFKDSPFYRINEFKEKEHLYFAYLMSRPEYLHAAVKYLLNVTLLPYQIVILQTLWTHKFPMLIASRGASKTFLMAVYAILRMVFMPGRRVMCVGASFRQSRFVIEYINRIYNNAPKLKHMFNGSNDGLFKGTEAWEFRMGQSATLAIPTGDAEKIRGYRCNDLLADEFSSHSKDTFETVLSGFLSVSANPVESVIEKARKRVSEELGVEFEEDKDLLQNTQNQLIIAGTPDYMFMNFGQYWKRWHQIIEANNDKDALNRILNQEEGDNFTLNSDQYAIVRLPYELIPEGVMEADQVSRAKASMNSGTYRREFGACFDSDSAGFFKRSLLESCTATHTNVNNCKGIIPDLEYFYLNLLGDKTKEYVMGVDPACSQDNFAITIVELHKHHRRVVYCWITNDKRHKKLVKEGYVTETDYYAYVCKKILDFMDRFNIMRIALDMGAGGAGRAILELLHNQEFMADRPLLWPTVDRDKPKDSDNYPGRHIIEPISFSDGKWVSYANHALKLDFEQKVLWFPAIDSASMIEAMSEDEIMKRNYDTLEDCIEDIQEMKTEISNITLTVTPSSNREKWVSPTIVSNGKKVEIASDRYSALLMANAVARDYTAVDIHKVTYEGCIDAGWAGPIKLEGPGEKLYAGNLEWANIPADIYD